MKKKTAIMLVIFMLFSSITFTAQASVLDETKLNEDLTQLKDVIQFVISNYQYSVDQDNITDGLYNGFFSVLDDYSQYFTSDEMNNFTTDISGQYVGIGISYMEMNGQIIIATIPGGPAEKAGLLTNDVLLSIDGKNIKGFTRDEISALLFGEEGTKLNLVILRKEQKINFTLRREIVIINSVESKIMDNNIGYLKIIEFRENVPELIEEALDEFDKQNVKKIVIDIRNNPGGTIDSATEALGFFVSEGPLFCVDYSDGNKDKIESSLKKQKYDIALLVNENSASASEIFAGAIQDRKAGKIIGTTTYGKGVMQSLYKLDSGAGIKFTMAEFFTANKNKIQGVGIIPDITIKNPVVDFSKYPHFNKERKAQKSDVGLDVLSTEMILNTLGYNVGKEDGVFDEALRQKLMLFQNDHKLYKSGTLDFTTQDTLSSALVEYSFTGVEDLQLNAAIQALK